MTPAAGADRRRPASSRRALAAIVLLAIAVRVALVFVSGGHGEMEGLSHRYQETAYAMAAGYGLSRPAEDAPAEFSLVDVVDRLAAEGKRLTPANAPKRTPGRWRPSAEHPPGYPLLLLALYRTVGPPVLPWAMALQILADALACLAVFAIGRRLVGERAGWIAGIGAAVFLPAGYLAMSRVADAWTPALFATSFWLLLRAIDGRSWIRWALCGACFGVLAQFRPDFLLAPPFFAVLALLAARDRRALVPGIAVMLVATTLVLLPWSLRNGRVTGRISPGTTAAGMTLLQGIGQFPNPYGIGIPDGWFADEAHRLGYEGLYDPRADRAFRERWLDIVRRDPGLFAKGTLRRLAISLVPPYHWGYANPNYEGHSFYDILHREGLGPAAALAKHPGEVLAANWDRFLFVPVAVVLLVSCGALVFLGGNARTALLVLAPWTYVVLVHLPFFLTTRMVVPGVFAQLIALGWLIERLRGRSAPLAPVARRD